MPRFSDVFVYNSVTDMKNGTFVFKECVLIKKVEGFDKYERMNEIVFDVVGMYLMFGTHGPYCLTVVS